MEFRVSMKKDERELNKTQEDFCKLFLSLFKPKLLSLLLLLLSYTRIFYRLSRVEPGGGGGGGGRGVGAGYF